VTASSGAPGERRHQPTWGNGADLAGITRHGAAAVRVAPSSLAATEEDPLDAAHLASADRVLDERAPREPQGIARIEDATLARIGRGIVVRAIGLLTAAAGSDPRRQLAAGTVRYGIDDVSEVRWLFGGTIDDARGFGGLEFSDVDQRRSGPSTAVSLTG